MKRSFVLASAVLFAAVAFGFSGSLYESLNGRPARESEYFRISKSLAIFGELFRQISSEYVDEVDPQEFVEAGIEGMLKHLDPYTTYIDDANHDEVDIMTSGVYGGLGITTGLVDSAVTIVGVTEGSPAETSGLRIGDRLYMIDNTDVMKSTASELRKFTRGKPGTKLTMKVIRLANRKNDTLAFQLTRQEVTLKNVSYSGLVGAPDAKASNGEPSSTNDIGFIRLERFTYGAAAEVAEAINKLRKQHPALKGWIVDLRDNPGGLLDAAVGISEMFAPKGSLIVSTRGRIREQEHSYYSTKPPVEPDAPLVVLVNDHSASASEIVAGALQDLDRAVIVGENSFGKGLVQTISSLPYNATLKMTTSKYYTPSGRCIQRVDYNQRRHGILKDRPDTNAIFKTRNGRTVRGFAGIKPDSTVSLETLSPVLQDLADRNLFFTFATAYAGRLSAIGSRTPLPQPFVVTKPIVNEFIAFARSKNAQSTNPALKELTELEQSLKGQHATAALKTVESIRAQLAKDYYKELERQSPIVSDVLREEIIERFYPRSKVIAQTLNSDIQVQAAVKILRSPTRYNALLAGK